MSENNTPRIKILAGGPYVVTGNVPLFELIIEPRGNGYIYRQGRVFPRQERYILCRCGKSRTTPFCDGAHVKAHFDGLETASRRPFREEADRLEGPTLDLLDLEELCAFARLCHTDEGDVWDLTECSDDPAKRALAIKTAEECPAGRLVALDRETGEAFEPEFEPSIVLLQDPQRRCSGPLWVRGGIQIEAADGYEYEVRNRATLCRCGESGIKPFCDACHVSYRFTDRLLRVFDPD